MEDFAQQIPEQPRIQLLQEKHTSLWFPIGLTIFIGLICAPIAIVLSQNGSTVGIASPLAQSSANTVTSPLGNTANATSNTPYSASQYISLAQQYFHDAYALSQKREQTDDDKKEIINNLQYSINTISEGIQLYPKRSDLWLQRASIYTAIAKIFPPAKDAAIKDLEQASALSGANQPSTNGTKSPAGLELVKDEQADSRDVLVAAPNETTAPTTQSSASSAFEGTGTIPAGQTTVTVQNAHVTDAGPIYVAPSTQTTANFSVIKKTAGVSFTVSIDNPQRADVAFKYWVTE